MQWLAYGLTIFAGMLNAIQPGCNATLNKALGMPFVAGMIASAVSGYLVIAFLLRYLRRHDFALFMWFRIAVAALILIVIASGARSATI